MFSGALKDLLSKFFRIEEITEHLSSYVESRVALLKLEIKEEVAKAMTRVMVIGVVILLALMVLFFFSVGIALFLNQYFEGAYSGFFLVAGLYLVILLVSYVLRKRILKNLDRFLNYNL